jgi:hypothetical protein
MRTSRVPCSKSDCAPPMNAPIDCL